MLADQVDALESRASSHEPTLMSFVHVWVGLKVAWGGTFVGSGGVLPVAWPDEWPTVHWLAWAVVFGGLAGIPVGRSDWVGLGWVGWSGVGLGLIGLRCSGVGCVVFDWICRKQCKDLLS